MGGAYSIDKQIRVAYGWGWWADEQPSEEIKKYVEQQLDESGTVDIIIQKRRLTSWKSCLQSLMNSVSV